MPWLVFIGTDLLLSCVLNDGSSITNKQIILKKIAFIVRGNLKKPDQFRANISRYFHSNYNVFLKFTRHAGHAIDIVSAMIEEEQVDYIVGVGGDGTFSEVVNGYMKVPVEKRKHVILAAFPRGAGNDFSRSTGAIQSVEHLHDMIERNKWINLDLGKVSYQNGEDQMIRYFDNSFDIGIGGLVCKYVNVSRKTWGSNFTYIYNILRAFLSFKRIPVKVVADNFSFEGEALLVSINNGKYFGSGLCVAPDAKLDDGEANVLIARKINILQFIWYVRYLRKAKPIIHPEVFYHRLSSCTIESEMRNNPIEMDGEVVGQTPLKIEILKHAARLLKSD